MEDELLAPFDPELVVRPGNLPRAVALVNAALLGTEVDPEPLESAFALTEAGASWGCCWRTRASFRRVTLGTIWRSFNAAF